MVDRARGEHHSVHAVEGTWKPSGILQFRSAHDECDAKGTIAGQPSAVPVSGDTAVASTRTHSGFDEGQTTYWRSQVVVATSAGASDNLTMDDLVLKRSSIK